MGRQFNIEEEDINFRRMVENIYGFIYQSEKESERERNKAVQYRSWIQEMRGPQDQSSY